MVEYINMGICTSIKIKKEDFEGEKIESVIKKLSIFINISLYDMMDFEKYIEFVVKEEVFKPKIIAEFLQEQGKINGMGKEEEAIEEYDKISKMKNMYEVLEFSNVESHYFKTTYNIKNLKIGVTKGMNITYITCVYSYAGRASIEYYKDFFMYIENLVEKNSKYKEIASLVKISIS